MTIRAFARQSAVSSTVTRRPRKFDRILAADASPRSTSEYYGCNTFSFAIMDKKLPQQDVETLKKFAVTDSRMRLTPELADSVAAAVKEWAIEKGATHYCHWFQPQTGSTAEKHDAFFSLDKEGLAVEKFTGAQLIQAEPDASSFPSGGVRATFEARGYTAWDASSPMFLMETRNGITLCIPSVFVSYSGEALDQKTPLMRSIKALSDIAVDSLKLLGHDTEYVTANAGPEQEYFVTDETLFNLRPDLKMSKRALIGCVPPKHQQMDDHYFGSIKSRVLACMMECEQELYKLGVPIKTRHNEVAPSQYEAAPIFENANVAADHNQLLMEVVETVAKRHGYVANFHEKPFSDINGSGKHVNWSLQSSDGFNLLEPGKNPDENIRFLYFLAACLKAVHEFGPLLRASVASAGNDFRLGANEAPPAIMSVFLGHALTNVFKRITGKGESTSDHSEEINLDLARVPVIARDNTDRNRTSPFAFTGNKFEFRAVGSSASISTPLVAINASVANSLQEMNASLREMAPTDRPTQSQILDVIKKTMLAAEAVCFDGDNYSDEWHQEAERRGLANLKNTPEALEVYRDPKVIKILADLHILTESETRARYHVQVEQYIKLRIIELETIADLVSTHVLPAALAQQNLLSAAIDGVEELVDEVPLEQLEALKNLVKTTNSLYTSRKSVKAMVNECNSSEDHSATANKLGSEGMVLMEHIKVLCNEVEATVDDNFWSLPKFRELLFMV